MTKNEMEAVVRIHRMYRQAYGPFVDGKHNKDKAEALLLAAITIGVPHRVAMIAVKQGIQNALIDREYIKGVAKRVDLC